MTDKRATTEEYALLLDWFLTEFGYPYDMRTDNVPPEPVQRAIEDWWVAKDACDDEEEAMIRRFCAEEGGWVPAHSVDSGATS